MAAGPGRRPAGKRPRPARPSDEPFHDLLDDRIHIVRTDAVTFNRLLSTAAPFGNVHVGQPGHKAQAAPGLKNDLRFGRHGQKFPDLAGHSGLVVGQPAFDFLKKIENMIASDHAGDTN